MARKSSVTSFGALFKKYRLRSEIETLAEFGDLLAEEGIVYETSLFTRWQNGERLPRDRETLLAVIRVFAKHGGIQLLEESNNLMESAGERDLFDEETTAIVKYLRLKKNTTLPDDCEIFVGREELIKDITWKIINKKQIWLHGMPGVGKTALALHIAHVLRDFFVDGIFWFRADIKDPQVILDELLNYLGYNAQGVANLEVKLNKLSHLIQGTNILLILDNATISLLSSIEIKYLFSLPISIMCTSLEISTQERIQKIKIESFSEIEYMNLAEKILAKPFIEVYKNQVKELGVLLGYLPISSMIVLKQIFLNPLQLQNYIVQIKQNKLNLSHVSYDNKDLYSAFEFSFNKLSLTHQKILVSCSLFDGTDFSVEVVAYINGSTKSIIKIKLLELLQLSFIDSSLKGRYRLHPAIKEILYKKIKKDQYIQLTQFYIKKLRGYPIGSKKCLHYLISEFENIIILLEKCYKDREYNLVTALWPTISFYVFYTGQWDLMYKYNTVIQNSYKRVGDLKGLGGYILEDIGRIYFFQNNYEKIKETFTITTSIAQKTADLTLMGVIKSKKGIMYHYTNQLRKSERSFLEAIKILSNTNRREELAKSYAYLSLVYAKLGNYKKVIQYSDMATKENDVLSNDSVWGFICVFMGLAFLHTGKNEKAEKYLLEGCRFEKKYHIKIGQAIGLQGLGTLYARQGNNQKGIKYLHKALNLYSELGMKKEEQEVRQQIT